MFYNRDQELGRLRNALARSRRQFLVVYGRRRVGKSTLLRQLIDKNDVYFQASQSDSALLRQQFTEQLAIKFPVFTQVIYPDWRRLFSAINEVAKERFTLIIDELPYIVQVSPEFPSELQSIIDDRESLKFDLIVCGSSQQMMRGLALSSTAPLYGRADEILKIWPLHHYWLTKHLPDSTPEEIVVEFATWGGIPRYWELRAQYQKYEDAVIGLILDPLGTLRDEPNRLLLDEINNTALSQSILAFIASGVHRISELGGRMQRPTTDLSRPLKRLIEMDYVLREVPSGSSVQQKKAGLYKLADPFLRFYYHFVQPNLSDLATKNPETIWQIESKRMPQFIGETWEVLCRIYLGRGSEYSTEFRAASRWWGKDNIGLAMEIDLLAMSFDKKAIIAGECKWSDVDNPDVLKARLIDKVKRLPFYKNQKIISLIFCKSSQYERDWLIKPSTIFSKQ